MPTADRREDRLIEWFVSEYEAGSWRDGVLNHPDHGSDGGVDGFATRADGRTLAIEHTLVEFFIGEREDFVRFRPFLPIENDQSLSLPGKIVYLDVPRGINQKGQAWRRTAEVLHRWLQPNLASLPVGESTAVCPATPDTPEILLDVSIAAEPDFKGRPPIIRRYGGIDVGESIEKALTEKLPKLVAAQADQRVLMLERNQMKMPERLIWEGVDVRRERFPSLSRVDMWIAETIGYDVMIDPESRDFVLFTHFAPGGRKVEEFGISRGELLWRHRHSVSGLPPSK
jgi:hypothetical protein